MMVGDQLVTSTTPKTHLKSKPPVRRGSRTESEHLSASTENGTGYIEKPKNFSFNDLRAECKFVHRLRIEALREYFRLRLSLIHEEQKNAPSMEIRATYSAKLKQLMDEFNAEKRQVKQELRSKNVNQELLKKHYIQIGKHQSETLRLNSRLATIQHIISSKSYGSAQSHSTSRFASSSSSCELQKPPQSPLSLERFTTKFPRNSNSRKTSYCEDTQSATGPLVELLEELPDVAQIGMPLDISQTSENIQNQLDTTDGTNDVASVVGTDNKKYAHQKQLIKKYAHKLWCEYKIKGDEFEPADVEEEDDDDFEVQNAADDNDGADEDEANSENTNVIPDNMLSSLCAEYLYLLIQSAHASAAARRALNSEKYLASYLVEEILGTGPNAENKGICSAGIKNRTLNVSHLLVDTNRLLAAKLMYETMAVWPIAEVMREANICIIEELFLLESQQNREKQQQE